MENLGLHTASWAVGGIAIVYAVMFFGMTVAFFPGHTSSQILAAVGIGAAFLVTGTGLLILGSILDHAKAIRDKM